MGGVWGVVGVFVLVPSDHMERAICVYPSSLSVLISHVALAGTRRDVDSWLGTPTPGACGLDWLSGRTRC